MILLGRIAKETKHIRNKKNHKMEFNFLTCRYYIKHAIMLKSDMFLKINLGNF